MTNNWLESEENESLIHAQKEELIHENLKDFYELCKRVKNVKAAGSLKSSRLNIIGLQSKIELHYAYEYSTTPTELFRARQIKFSVSRSGNILIDIYSELHFHEGKKSKPNNIFNKECLNQDILDWTEEKKINTIRWLIFELDSFEEYLPGFNEGLIEKEKLNQRNLLLELEIKEKKANDSNRMKSILTGLLGGIIGLGVGYIVGYILGNIIWGIFAFFHNDIGDQGIRNIKIATGALSMICGFYLGYEINRKEY